MLLIACPNCGPRNSSEFVWRGEVKPRPDVSSATPEQWRSYLYEHDNLAGWVVERWVHRTGCRAYLQVERNTISNEIRSVTLVNKGQG